MLNVKIVDSGISWNNQAFNPGDTVSLPEEVASDLIKAGHAIIVDTTAQAEIDAEDPTAAPAMADELIRGVADGDPEDNPGAIDI